MSPVAFRRSEDSLSSFLEGRGLYKDFLRLQAIQVHCEISEVFEGLFSSMCFLWLFECLCPRMWGIQTSCGSFFFF